jgi:hypothetical protein
VVLVYALVQYILPKLRLQESAELLVSLYLSHLTGLLSYLIEDIRGFYSTRISPWCYAHSSSRHCPGYSVHLALCVLYLVYTFRRSIPFQPHDSRIAYLAI